jgi:hypothetical protein
LPVLQPFGFFAREPRRDPKALSDEELLRICAPAPGEDTLLGLGCLGVPVTLLVLFIVALIYGTAAKPLLAWLVLTTAMLFLAHHLIGLPKRRYREELNCRRSNLVCYRPSSATCVVLRRRAYEALLSRASITVILFGIIVPKPLRFRRARAF